MRAIGQTVRHPLLPRLGLALGGLTTSSLGTLSFPTLAPFERASFHLGTVEVGALTALIYIGAVGASFPAGRLTDALGAARTLALGQGTIMLGVALAALAPARAVFLAAVVIAGLGYGAVNPSTNVIATSRVWRRRRGTFMGAKQTGATAGGLLAGAVLPGAAALMALGQPPDGCHDVEQRLDVGRRAPAMAGEQWPTAQAFQELARLGARERDHRMPTSPSTSASSPPRPTATAAPASGSRRKPTSSSVPASWRCSSSGSAPAPKRSSIKRAAAATASASSRASATPPLSVLCSSPPALSTNGPAPAVRAAPAASCARSITWVSTCATPA